jgi:hypothetical protein
VECAQLSKRAQWDGTFAGGRVLAEFDPHTRTVSTEHHFAGSSYLAAPRSLQQADSPLLSLWRLPPQIHQRHEYPPMHKRALSFRVRRLASMHELSAFVTVRGVACSLRVE